MPSPADPAHTLFEAHPRRFEANRYVYPVLSRRSAGISLGVNLSGDKACNFRCVYCQVDRPIQFVAGPGQSPRVDVPRLGDELERTVELVTSGRIYRETKFCDTPEPLRRLNDLALSGDGEPTMYANFEEVLSACAAVCRRLDDVKLVLITNASLLHLDRVRRALTVLDAVDGEIWAKLDAGTEAYYREVARSAVPFQQILDNLRQAAKARPIVIQSLLMRIHGEPPSPAEQAAYGDRLGEILAAGGRIKLVQLHTVARRPDENWVAALSDVELAAAAERVRRRTGLPVATYGPSHERRQR